MNDKKKVFAMACIPKNVEQIREMATSNKIKIQTIENMIGETVRTVSNTSKNVDKLTDTVHKQAVADAEFRAILKGVLEKIGDMAASIEKMSVSHTSLANTSAVNSSFLGSIKTFIKVTFMWCLGALLTVSIWLLTAKILP